MPGSSMPTVVALTARSAPASAASKAESRGRRWRPRSPAPRPRSARRGPWRSQSVRLRDGHPARPGVEARIHDRVRRAARTDDDDVAPGQRAPHRELRAGPEPRRVGVDADQPPVVLADDVVDRADPLGVRLDLVDEPGDHPLVRRGHAEPEPALAARLLRRPARPPRAPARAGRSARRCPAASNAASCMTCECRRLSGLPSRPTRRVIGSSDRRRPSAATASVADGPGRPSPGT